MHLQSVSLGDARVLPLLRGLSLEYERRYGAATALLDADAAEFEPPFGLFLVLIDHETTIAGGGLRRIDNDTAELKRLWTSPSREREGHATRVVRALENVARASGYHKVRLLTGPAQPEALGLYAKLGYLPAAHYGPYPEGIALERMLESAAHAALPGNAMPEDASYGTHHAEEP